MRKVPPFLTALLPALSLWKASFPSSSFLLDFPAAWNAADFELGGRLGGAWSLGPGRLEGLLDLQWRPYRKAIWTYPSPETAIQYREDRFSIGPGIGYQYPLLDGLGTRIVSGLSYSHGDYRGTLKSAESDWYPWVDFGLMVGGKSLFQGGCYYQWRPLPHISPHRIALEIGFRFHPDDSH